jgi:hypothetical protein
VPTRSLRRSTAELKRELDPATDLVDLGLDVCASNGRVIFQAGGTWNKQLRTYAGQGGRAQVKLVGSQLDAAEQLAGWFLEYESDNPNRQSLLIYVDKRRGGKTVFIGIAVGCFAVRYPRSHLGPTICAIVVPTFAQEREIHEVLRIVFPAEWFADGRIVYHKSENYYELANGAQIWVKSADREDGLKLGRFSAVAINEAQQIKPKAVVNVLGSNIDSGGITFMAMNPPDSVKALWAEDLHDALQEVDDRGHPVLAFAKEIGFPSEKNEMIDSQAMTRFRALTRIIDPKQEQRDGAGIWASIKDRAYPMYTKGAVRAEPTGWQDITSHVNGLTNRGFGNRDFGAGMDYQRRPWCAFVEAKVYEAPAGVWVPQGSIVYVVRAEICNDIKATGGFWTEDMLCQKIDEHLKSQKRKQSQYLLIGDATGHYQGATAMQRGVNSDPTTWSWAIAQRWGWDPHAPIEKQEMLRHGQYDPATMKTTYSNPRVLDRLDTINTVLEQGRLIITPDCPQTAESFRKCEVYTDTKKPKGWGAHLTDAVGYLIYTWEQALIHSGRIKPPVQPEKRRRAA